MSTLLKPIWVREQLIEKNLYIFTPHFFSRLFNASPETTKYFLETQVREGLFLRLKRGLYALATDHVSVEHIANALYAPSYLSLEYALSYYHLIPETVYTITSITSKPTRLFSVRGLAYTYQSIKKSAFTGYSLVTYGDNSFLMADVEKSLVDYLYFVLLEHKTLNDRLDLTRSSFDSAKALEYSSLFHSPGLTALVQQIIQGHKL